MKRTEVLDAKSKAHLGHGKYMHASTSSREIPYAMRNDPFGSV